jgi:hypothetical protein
MSSYKSVKRVMAGGALLIWCALTALIPAADAAAERASAGSRAHVEALGGGAKCVPVHDQLACQLCRLLRLPTKSGDATVLFALSQVAQSAAPSTPLVLASREGETGQFSRAPPSA